MRYSGTEGDDVILGTDQNDKILARNGDDLISGFDQYDRLNGGPGDDTMRGGLDNDFLTGGLGNDVYVGGRGNDLLFFGPEVDGSIDKVLDFRFPEKGDHVGRGDYLYFNQIDANANNTIDNDTFEHSDGPAAFSLWVEDTPRGHVEINFDVDGDAVSDGTVRLIDRHDAFVAADFSSGFGFYL